MRRRHEGGGTGEASEWVKALGFPLWDTGVTGEARWEWSRQVQTCSPAPHLPTPAASLRPPHVQLSFPIMHMGPGTWT